jgi:hypothetical protein
MGEDEKNGAKLLVDESRLVLHLAGSDGAVTTLGYSVSNWAECEVHEIVAAWGDTNKARLYVDGSEVRSTNGISLPTAFGGLLAVGDYYGQYHYEMTNCLEEFRVYDRMLAPPLDDFSRTNEGFWVHWDASMSSADVADYTVEVKDLAAPELGYVRLLENTTAKSTWFNGADGHGYRFRVLARDENGNVEVKENDLGVRFDVYRPIELQRVVYNSSSSALALEFSKTMDVTPAELVDRAKIRVHAAGSVKCHAL